MPVRRPSNALIASIIVHLIVALFFVQALVMRRPLIDFFGRNRINHIGPVERIGFLQLPRQPAVAPPTPGKRGGDGRAALPAPPLVIPRVIPPALPPSVLTPTPPQTDRVGIGPLIGGGGETRGIQPHYDDPRLWTQPGTIATAPKTPSDRLDSLVQSVIGAHNDSVRIANGSQRDPGDWTVQHNGQKYGIDRKFIRLGPVSIPTSILALLPLNVSTSPAATDRERRSTAIHDEIFSRASTDADFDKAVRSVRERMDREHREHLQKQKAADSSAASAK